MERTILGLDCEALVRDLRSLGIRAGDSVYAHTSMKRIGWIEGGAQTLLTALLTCLGPEGTLAVPTHTVSFDRKAPYDPKMTPTGLGTFPNAVWRDPRALRSGHASHSCAAIGAKAAWLTERHDPRHALGYDSPLHRLYREGGRVLLLGVTYRACTALHLAESLAAMPYVKLPYDASWGPEVFDLRPDGSVAAYAQSEFPGCSSAFDRIAPHLPGHAVRLGRVGGADAILADIRPLVETATAILHAKPDFFLCASEGCPCCPARHRLLGAPPQR
ncbi:MAG TPA: AAC(3) family N-acetyltransferase [Clostridia bacterium]|nr:AAC(3) family N-acetyltransferase [Clostridia bacterium]